MPINNYITLPELSASSGASLMGYNQGSTGATPTVQVRLGYIDGVSPTTTGTDGNPVAAVNAYRNTSAVVGGTPGYVNPSIYNLTVTGAAETSDEWGILGVLNNYSATVAQNVAIYGQGNKHADGGGGGTWAAVMEFHDRTGNASPTSGCIGLEVDMFADGADANGVRVAIDVVGGPGVSIGPSITYGIRIGPLDGATNDCNFINGLYTYGAMTNAITVSTTGAVGINLSGATLTGAAVRLAEAQFISFEATDAHQLLWTTSDVLHYKVSGTNVLTISDAGAMAITGGISLNGTTAISGTFSTGSITPSLASKPGSLTTMLTWMSVVINGTQGWIPVFNN